MDRPTYHHGDLRAVILTEAARLVAERGADRVSLRELARGAGVSTAAPAYHFSGRPGLFTVLAPHGVRS
jgi:AcrR family transcriptional regulator